MNRHLRLQTGRRRDAIDRLRGLTASAVVAGTAGTIGFGILAAATFTGKASAAEPVVATQPLQNERQTTGGTGTNRDGGGTVTAPDDVFGQGFGTTPNPRPAGARPGHAATGGSG